MMEPHHLRQFTEILEVSDRLVFFPNDLRPLAGGPGKAWRIFLFIRTLGS